MWPPQVADPAGARGAPPPPEPEEKGDSGQPRGRAGRSPWWWCSAQSGRRRCDQFAAGVRPLCSVKPSRAATRCTVRVVVWRRQAIRSSSTRPCMRRTASSRSAPRNRNRSPSWATWTTANSSISDSTVVFGFPIVRALVVGYLAVRWQRLGFVVVGDRPRVEVGNCGHDGSPFCESDWCAGQRWGAGKRVRVGGQPRRVRAGCSPGFRPRSPARSALGRAGIRAENSHSARRCPVRAWVERSGPRPLTMSTLLTAKEVRGYGFRPPQGAASAVARGATPPINRKKKGGPGQPRVLQALTPNRDAVRVALAAASRVA